MMIIRGIGIALGLTLAPVSGDIVSGTITDAHAGAPLSGVKVSADQGAGTLSGPDGAFSLDTDTDPAALIPPNRLPERSLRYPWEGVAGAFPWYSGGRSGKRGIRNALGSLVYSHPDESVQAVPQAGSAPPAAHAPPAKAAALNTIRFEKTGYVGLSRQVDGSQSGLAIQLQKAAEARKADLTWFESYPDPGSEECIKYNGCAWAGQFAAVNGKQPESWVAANNICAVHEKDFAKYRLKTLRLTQGTKTIDVKVYDMCSDSDCDGCCTENAKSGFLIDVEKYTAERFGTRTGTVDWVCVDCAD